MRPRARSAVVAALLACAALALGVVCGALLGGGPGRPAATPAAGAAASGPTSGPTSGAVAGDRVAPGAVPARAAALQVVLDARATALLARDRTGWLAGTGGAYRSQQGAVLDRVAGVRFTRWTWRYLGPGPALPAARAQALPRGAWVARVALEWSVAPSGAGSVRRLQDLTVAPVTAARPGAAAVRVVADTDGPTQVDLWDLAAVAQADSSRAVVLGTAPAARLAPLARLVDAAAAAVDATWGTAWPRTTVVEVPATTTQLADLLSDSGPSGASTGGLDQLAAVTTGELAGSSGATTGDRVLVAPEGFAQLSAAGQEVVLTHELVHVATAAGATRSVPRWLGEGFADWIAYARSGLGPDQVASDLLTRVREGRAPDALPADAAFDPARTDVGPAYSGAWLAVRELASRCGARGVVAVYRASAGWSPPGSSSPSPSSPSSSSPSPPTGEAAVDAALTSACGTDRAELVAAWRSELAALAADLPAGPAPTSAASAR